MNDSRDPRGSNRDRHAPIRKGEIGRKGFRAFLGEPRLQGLPAVLEGPGIDGKARSQRHPDRQAPAPRGDPEPQLMLLNRRALDGIAAGEIDLAFRRWKRPTVRAGGTLRTRAGVLVDRLRRADQPAPDQPAIGPSRRLRDPRELLGACGPRVASTGSGFTASETTLGRSP